MTSSCMLRFAASLGPFFAVFIQYRPKSVAGIFVSVSMGVLLAPVFNLLIKLFMLGIPDITMANDKKCLSKWGRRINDALFIISFLMVPS
jgi:hypothetical protein